MRRGTTPTLTLTVTGVSTLETDHVYVTIQQGGHTLTIESTDDTYSYDSVENVISITMTQEQTLLFGEGKGSVQVRGISAGGSAWASSIKSIDIGRILLDGEIDYD